MSYPQRVLIIEPQGDPGGLWHYACCLVQALEKSGLEVALATNFPYEPLDGDNTIPVWPIGRQLRETRPRPVFLIRRAVNHVAKWRRLDRVIKAFRPDIVHLHSPLGNTDFLYFKHLRSNGVPVVYTAHDAKPFTGISWFDWARYREADAVVVLSSKAFEDLVTGGVEASKIARLHHGNYLRYCRESDLTREDAKRLLGIPSGAHVVLFFGTIAPYKGLDVLIDAFSLLLHEEPDLYLIVAGQPLEDFAPYRRQIERLDLAKRVILDLQYIPFAEVPKYFLSADVVAFPYREIYQSGVVQLAYGFSRPVVGTNVGGLGETITEDQTGLVAEEVEARALARAIGQVLAEPAKAEAMGRRGRQLAETKYSWSAIAQKTAEIYRSVHSAMRIVHP
jgi:D-inositol-3-phosphate glycosyltransferase